MNTLRVLTIGSAVRDVFLQSPGFTVIRSPQFSGGYGECVSLGSKVEVVSCTFATGGGATNAAATFSRLGFATGVLAKVGADEQGKSLVEDLRSYGIDTRLIKQERRAQTAYSTLLTTEDGERTVLVFRGVSADWKLSDIPPLPEGLRVIYLTSLGGNLDVAERIFERAHKKGILIAWNPGSAELHQASRVNKLLSQVSILLLNKEEAEILTAKQGTGVPTLAATLHRVCALVVITDGPQGSYAHDEKALWFARSNKVASVSRTGAGDAFGSGFVAARLRDLDTATALQVGTLNAENVIQHVGAKTGILRAWPSQALRARVRVTPVRS
jgi:sugar/nucleoside kinase (ribokinase family)